MQFRRSLFLRLTLLGLILSPLSAPADRAFEETFENQRSFRLFGGPTREGPEAQWERVQDFVKQDRLRPAIRHAGFLVGTWPDHPRAPEAQKLIGDLQARRNRPKEAFHAYQLLIDAYAGQFNYSELIRTQIELARSVETREIRALFGRYTDPLEAVPLYRQIITNAPHAEETPALLFRIGEIFMEKSQPAEAIAEFDLFEQRYPAHPLAKQAALRRAEAYARLARRHATDASTTRSAWLAYRYFLQTYPGAEEVEEARKQEQYFYNRLAGMHFEQARFYQENMRRPDAALVAFQSMVQQFPDSTWTEEAVQRIQDLQPPPATP